MHYRHVFFTWIVCLLVSSCASTVQVDTDYDPENDFSGYRSYDWHDEVSAPNQIVEDRMRNAIELALIAWSCSLRALAIGLTLVTWRYAATLTEGFMLSQVTPKSAIRT